MALPKLDEVFDALKVLERTGACTIPYIAETGEDATIHVEFGREAIAFDFDIDDNLTDVRVGDEW